jgi:hypothetical protein
MSVDFVFWLSCCRDSASKVSSILANPVSNFRVDSRSFLVQARQRLEKATSEIEISALQNLIAVADSSANLVTVNITKASWTSLQTDVLLLKKHKQPLSVHTARCLTLRNGTDLFREAKYDLWIHSIWPQLDEDCRDHF